MRLANDIAAAAMEHVRGLLRPGMREAEAAALWQGFVHGEGTGWQGKVELALPFSLVWAGRGIKTFTATGDLPVVEGEPVLFEIWVCADGYWADHTKNLVIGELTPEYAELEARLMEIYAEALASIRPGASMAELDRHVRERIAPTHPICHGVGARAHEPPYPHQAGGGEFAEGMVLAVEPGIYWEGGGGLRVEDNFLVTTDGVEKLSVVSGRSGARVRPDLDGIAQRHAPHRRARRPLRHDAPRRRADRRRRALARGQARDRAVARRAWDRADRGRASRASRTTTGARSSSSPAPG